MAGRKNQRRTMCGYCSQKKIRGCRPQPKKGTVEHCPFFEQKPLIGRHPHRKIMAETLGRSLGHWEFVHHVNGNHSDNRLDNLFLCSPGEHIAIHRMMKQGITRADALVKIIRLRERGNYSGFPVDMPANTREMLTEPFATVPGTKPRAGQK